jgi:hypothetical protein
VQFGSAVPYYAFVVEPFNDATKLRLVQEPQNKNKAAGDNLLGDGRLKMKIK